MFYQKLAIPIHELENKKQIKCTYLSTDQELGNKLTQLLPILNDLEADGQFNYGRGDRDRVHIAALVPDKPEVASKLEPFSDTKMKVVKQDEESGRYIGRFKQLEDMKTSEFQKSKTVTPTTTDAKVRKPTRPPGASYIEMDSVLDQIFTIYKANKANFKSAVGRALIGTRVITKYNNRTYCVDDIVWDKNPETTFPDRVSSHF